MRCLPIIRILGVAPLLVAVGLFGTVGCETKEKVLDVETPGGEVEVTRDRETGDVDVEAGDKERILDINTPGADVEVKRDGDTGSVEVDAEK